MVLYQDISIMTYKNKLLKRSWWYSVFCTNAFGTLLLDVIFWQTSQYNTFLFCSKILANSTVAIICFVLLMPKCLANGVECASSSAFSLVFVCGKTSCFVSKSHFLKGIKNLFLLKKTLTILNVLCCSMRNWLLLMIVLLEGLLWCLNEFFLFLFV